MVSATKDPVKVRAGTIGALTRWGDTPRVIRLDELTPPQRRLVLALVDAAKNEKAAPVVSETSTGTAQEAHGASRDPSDL